MELKVKLVAWSDSFIPAAGGLGRASCLFRAAVSPCVIGKGGSEEMVSGVLSAPDTPRLLALTPNLTVDFCRFRLPLPPLWPLGGGPLILSNV